ncbi:unnamed protein product [Penicillium manginii]
MASIQLKFTLQAPPNVKTIHLVGSWDNYSRQHRLHSEGQEGLWSGELRSPLSVLQPGHRYGYYYIMDGYQISHDEAPINRKLEFFDIPSDLLKPDPYNLSQRSGKFAIPPCVSSTEIKHPQPSKPFDPNLIYKDDFAPNTNRLSCGTAGSSLSDGGASSYSENSHRSSGTSNYSDSSNSTLPPLQSPTQHNLRQCHCDRYGITRTGDRVKLNCGGSRCEYLAVADDSDCSESAANGGYASLGSHLSMKEAQSP